MNDEVMERIKAYAERTEKKKKKQHKSLHGGSLMSSV